MIPLEARGCVTLSTQHRVARRRNNFILIQSSRLINYPSSSIFLWSATSPETHGSRARGKGVYSPKGAGGDAFCCCRLFVLGDTYINTAALTRPSPQVNNHFTETTAGEGGAALIISGAGGKADPSSPYLVYIITEGEAREGAAGRGLRTPQATRAASVHQSERRGGVSGSVVHLPVRSLPSSF